MKKKVFKKVDYANKEDYQGIFHQPDCKGFPSQVYLVGDSLTGFCSCVPLTH